MGEFEISSFSNGSELKAALRRQNFEIILMDFHLGQGRNGVEWVQQLRQSQFIRPSTGIIFITADRLPQTVGQIIDTQPDLFVIKPYNIATLTRGLKHYLSYRSFVKQALDALDNNDAENALRIINQLDSEQTPGRLKNDVVKLHARILFQLGKLLEAKKLYETVLAHSDKVLWAQWGKIKCEYLAGNWSHCRNELSDLMTNSLARDKAFEWLACLCFEQEAWSQAEFYLDHIKISELSVPATRLKSLTYQKQDKVIEGIELLQKKRDYNRSTRERFNEFTVELAEFYLSIAEQQPKTNRDESLSQARRLIGIASRAQVDQQQIQKKDYLLAFAASLEDDHDKVTQILSLEHMDLLSRTDPATLTIAAKTHNAIGNSEKARELLAMAHERNHLVGNLASQTLNEQVLTNAELDMGMAEERSLELNNTGMRLFIGRDYIRAMYYFYQAYQMQPSTAAFGLNLVQCMLESRHANYRSYTVPALLSKLDVGALNNSNRKRLHQLRTQAQAEASFFYAEQTPDNENAQDSAS
ncbi:hypothetical protein BFC18_06025 [Alteromonas confluentis]|uniref:Response regulatory domain-containing protein n=2 Tax=Alteromonas confluentis TaxID=1656094 RepID=A0A1E7ZEF6_9ALTE|nr:hypothetical protein BFC18_06025 [Alteromonas confluentis]